MTEDLGGQVALVTGSSRGIGRAIATHLAAAGAHVGINYLHNRGAAEEALRLVTERGGSGELVPFDVSERAAVEDAFARLIDRNGRIDILVNNAGVPGDGLLARLKEAEWDRVVAVNLKGAYNCARAVVRAMVRARYGRIVNLTSVVAATGNAGQTAYAAAKAGVVGFTKALAREVASRGITVNAVAPGLVETEMTDGLARERQAAYVGLIPAGRCGTTEEVAELVSFLVRPAAGYITGQTIHINGGLYM